MTTTTKLKDAADVLADRILDTIEDFRDGNERTAQAYWRGGRVVGESSHRSDTSVSDGVLLYSVGCEHIDYVAPDEEEADEARVAASGGDLGIDHAAWRDHMHERIMEQLLEDAKRDEELADVLNHVFAGRDQ